MSITAKTYVIGTTIGTLNDAVAAAILAGGQPEGNLVYDDKAGHYVQAIITGSAPTANDTIVSNITALQARDAETSYSADGAIAVTSGVALLSKSTTGAYTLAAGAAGAVVELIVTTAHAHVVTATGLIDDGTTGGAKSAITFAAFVGSSIRLRSTGAHWAVTASNNITSIV
jgi:hypothetical protein